MYELINSKYFKIKMDFSLFFKVMNYNLKEHQFVKTN